MIIKITLEDTRPKAIFHNFSYLIDSSQFSVLRNGLGAMENEKVHSRFTDIGYALQLAIRPEKNHSPDRTPPLVTLVYQHGGDEEVDPKIVLGYQLETANKELEGIIYITEVNLDPKSIVGKGLNYLKTLAKPDGNVVLNYSVVESEFPTTDLALVEYAAQQLLEKKYKPFPFLRMNGSLLTIKLHPKHVYKKIVNDESKNIDMDRFYDLFPQARLDLEGFVSAANAKLHRVADKIKNKNEKILRLRSISSSQEAIELLPDNLIWHEFITTKVGPATRLLKGEVRKLEGLTEAFNQVNVNDFTIHFGNLALEYDAHQAELVKMKNDLPRMIQLTLIHLWSWMVKKLNYKLPVDAIPFYHAVFGDFVKVKTIESNHVLQFENLYDPDFNLINKYNAMLAKLKKQINYTSPELHGIMGLLMFEIKANLRNFKVHYKNEAENKAEAKDDKDEIIFEVVRSDGYKLSDANFQRHLAREIAYDNTELMAVIDGFHNAADSSLAEEGVDPLMNSFGSIVAESMKTLDDIRKIKSLFDALTTPVRNSNQLMQSADVLYHEIKAEYDVLSAAAENVGLDFTEVDDEQVKLTFYHTELLSMSAEIKAHHAAIVTSDSLESARHVSDTVHFYLTPPVNEEQNKFSETLKNFKDQAEIMRELNIRHKALIEQKIMDNHYIDTVLKYKSFLQGEIDYWHHNTSQFLCIGGTRAVGTKLKVPRGIAEMIKIVNGYGTHNLDGERARDVWADLQQVSLRAQQRKTGVGLFYFNLRKDPPSKLYQLTGSRFDINSQEDVSIFLREINNDWRYIPIASVTESNPFNDDLFTDFYQAKP